MKRMGIPLIATMMAAPLTAGAEVIDLQEIVVSANLEATAANRTGATVNVVTEEDLQATAETRVIDFLNRLPGVNVLARGGLGAQAGLTVRGASQNYVAVLVDGIDVTDPSGTQVAYDFGQLNTAGISRIEVLKGSQSALYGSRAVGGVISITTRRATEPGTHHQIEAEVGSYGTRALSYGVTHRTDRADLAVTLSHVATDGFSSADENAGNTEADGFRANRLSFNGSYILENGARIGASGFIDDGFGEYDPQYYADPDRTGDRAAFFVPFGDGETPDEFFWRDSNGLRVFGEFDTGAVRNTLAVSRFNIERRYVENEVSLDFGDYDVGSDTYGTYAFPSDNTYNGARTGLSYRGATDIGPAGRLVFGADWAQEDYEQAGTYGALEAATRIAGIYGEVTYALGDRLDLAATLRHDDHSRFGNHTTGRLALAYRMRDDLILRAQAGTGFRAPSNYELFSFYGSPTLAPEESRNFDLGIEKRYGDRGFLRATAFYLEVDNLIDYDFDGTGCDAFVAFGWPGCYNQVPGTSRRQGIELEGQVALNDQVTLGAAYTYTDSATNASSAWATVPRHDIGLSLGARLTPQLSGMVTLKHAADRGALPDYSLAGATMIYEFDNKTEAYARVENLFNEQYQLVNGYGTSDRAVYVGLRKSF